MPKYVYRFSEGDKDQKDLLGGKGANLAEMTRLGLPVPPGFTIPTECCVNYYADGKTLPATLRDQVAEGVKFIEAKVGKKFGDAANPLLVSVRSGARASRAESALADTGTDHLHVLDGGITAWESAGGDVVAGEGGWDLERQVRLVAGSIVLTGILASTVVPQAKWLSAGIGAGLTGAALTNTCAMGALLSRMPHNRRHEPTPEAVFAQLRGGRN